MRILQASIIDKCAKTAKVSNFKLYTVGDTHLDSILMGVRSKFGQGKSKPVPPQCARKWKNKISTSGYLS